MVPAWLTGNVDEAPLGPKAVSPAKPAESRKLPGGDDSGTVAVATPLAPVTPVAWSAPIENVTVLPASGKPLLLSLALTLADPPVAPDGGVATSWSTAVGAIRLAADASKSRLYAPRLSEAVTRPTPFAAWTMNRMLPADAPDGSVHRRRVRGWGCH